MTGRAGMRPYEGARTYHADHPGLVYVKVLMMMMMMTMTAAMVPVLVLYVKLNSGEVEDEAKDVHK